MSPPIDNLKRKLAVQREQLCEQCRKNPLIDFESARRGVNGAFDALLPVIEKLFEQRDGAYALFRDGNFNVPNERVIELDNTELLKLIEGAGK